MGHLTESNEAQLADVSIREGGHLFINGVEMLNQGWRLELEPNSIAVLHVKIPVLDLGTDPVTGKVSVVYVATWLDHITVEGPTVATALRILADRLEAEG